MPNFEVWATPIGERQLRGLRGAVREQAKRAMDDLERSGCEAADYRLEGQEVERLCVLDLSRDWRMIVAFPAYDEVAVILVGRHIDRRPTIDVYRQLYRKPWNRAPDHRTAARTPAMLSRRTADRRP